MNVLVGALMVNLIIGQRPAHPDVVERFVAMTCDDHGQPVDYRLHVPLTARRRGRTWPLVIWFHGRGESGRDNREQLAWLELIFGYGERRREIGALVVAMQVSAEESSWGPPRWGRDGPLDRLDAVVRDVIQRQPVDHDRIYLAGISQGASACWQYARRHPRRFAAMLPMATCAVGSQVSAELQGLPIWAFQSTGDGPAQVARMQHMIKGLADSKTQIRLTTVENPTHDCWTEALTRYRAWSWLMRQRRGRASGRFLGAALLSRPVLAWAAVILLAYVQMRWRANAARS
jgi:predicted peptidase